MYGERRLRLGKTLFATFFGASERGFGFRAMSVLIPSRSLFLTLRVVLVASVPGGFPCASVVYLFTRKSGGADPMWKFRVVVNCDVLMLVS